MDVGAFSRICPIPTKYLFAGLWIIIATQYLMTFLPGVLVLVIGTLQVTQVYAYGWLIESSPVANMD